MADSNPNITATDEEGNELTDTQVEVNGVVPGEGGGGGAFEDTDGDGVAELQDTGASFEDGRAQNIGGTTEKTVVENSGTDYTIDASRSGVYYVTLTDNVSFSMAGSTTGATDTVTVFLEQDSTGGRSITWPSGVLWDGGSTPGFSTGANDLHAVTFLNVNGNWIGLVGGENFA